MSASVLLTAYASNPSFAGGGPAWTVVHLLKAAKNGAANGYGFTAVFIDSVLRSIGDIDPAKAVDRRFAGLPLVHYVWPTAQYAVRLRRTAASLRRGGRPLIVNAHDVLSAYLAGWLLPSTRRVLTIHTIGDWVSAGFLQLRPHLRGSPAERFFRYVERDAVRRADVIVFPSEGAAGLFEGAYPGILDGRDVRIINTGLDTEAIAKVPADRTPLEPHGIGGRRLVLCVAAHVREKGLDVLVNAVAELPAEVRDGVAVVIVGRGPLTAELESLVRARGLERTVYLINRVPDVIGLMKAADLFVLTPAQTVFDVVLLEAMACGLPVITTRLGGNLEMFGEDSALLVPPRESTAVREAIVRLLDDEGQRRSLAERAYRRLRERFTLRRMLEGYTAVYQSLSTPAGAHTREDRKGDKGSAANERARSQHSGRTATR